MQLMLFPPLLYFDVAALSTVLQNSPNVFAILHSGQQCFHVCKPLGAPVGNI